MKKTVLLVVALVLSLSVGLQVAKAATKTTFSGESATANFQATDVVGCMVTNVYVLASNGSFNTSGQKKQSFASSGGVVVVHQSDSCSGVETMSLVASMSFSPDQFKVGGKLSLANMTLVTGSWDLMKNDWGPNLEINLTWVSTTGKADVSNNNFHLNQPGLHVNSTYHGSTRLAQAAGYISIIGGANLVPTAALYADISGASSGTIEIYKNK